MANSFKIVGVEQLQEKLKSHPAQVSKAIDFEIKETLNEIMAEQMRNAPKDRGPLAQNITMQHIGPLQYKVLCQVPYAAYIEFGTGRRFKAIPDVDASPYKGGGGNKGGGGFFDNILKWVKRKGIAYGTTFKVETRRKKGGKKQDAREMEAAMAIYKSILRNGIRPNPFFFGPLLTRRTKLKEKIEAAIKRYK